VFVIPAKRFGRRYQTRTVSRCQDMNLTKRE
jgi:hypothetical protein